MAAPPPKAPAKPALQPLPFATAHIVSCAEDVATIIPKLVVLGMTDPNRTVERTVLDKTFDVKYKLGIKYNERERLGPEWKPEEGEWKKWITAELRLVKLYAGHSFNDVFTKDVARELKTNLDVGAFRATKSVKKNSDGSDNSRELFNYEYRLPTSFKVRVEINPYHPMVPPLNLHKSNTWGTKTKELIRKCVNGASTRHVRLLAQGDFRMDDKIAELPIETYLSDPRPLPRNISNDDFIKESKDRLTMAIRDTRHPTPYKLALMIDWPSWCKRATAKIESKPTVPIEDDTQMTIHDNDLPAHSATPAPKTASKRRPKSAVAIEDDLQGTQSALVKVKKEPPTEPSEPDQALAPTKTPPPPTNRHSPPLYGHPSPKLRPVLTSPFTDLPAPARDGQPSPLQIPVKVEPNILGRHSTPAEKALKKGKRATSSEAEPSTAAPSSVPSSDKDKSGAVKIIWGAKDQHKKVTKLGTSKRNCRACGAKMSCFVVLLDHLKSDQTHLGKEIKLQYWGDGQTVSIWMIDLPTEYGGTKRFVETGREMKWKWLNDEARMASSTPFAPGSGLAPGSTPLQPRSSRFAPRLYSPAPPSQQSPPLSVSVFSPAQAVETKKYETEPAVFGEDH